MRRTLAIVLLLLLMPAVVSAQSASDIAYQHSKILDTYSRVIDTVSYNYTNYHIIKYYNVFPYANGIEIISASGSEVSDPNIAKPILAMSAWKKTVTQLKQSDIDALDDIVSTTQGLYGTIAQIDSGTRSVIDKIAELKSLYLFGDCALDIVESSYPEITTLKSELNVLNNSLAQWKADSTMVNNNLTDVIRGFDALRTDKEMESELPQNIQELVPAIETLKTETVDTGTCLSNASSTLTYAERAINNAAESSSETITAGSMLSKEIAAFAGTVGTLNDWVKALRADVQPISGSLSERSSTLSRVMEVSNSDTANLYDSWSSRRNAPVMVYSSLGGIIAVVFAIIFGALIYVMGRETIKQPVKDAGEAESVLTLNAEWSQRRITGLIITTVGLILLLYSFITAYKFCIANFSINEPFLIRIIFLSCMIGIGVYLTEKGATLPEHSVIIGIILVPIGLSLLSFSFLVANTFVNGELLFDILFIVKIVFLLCMIEIGGYLTGRGVTLSNCPTVTGVVLTPIGAAMLIFSFITASVFVTVEFRDFDTFIVIISYFICMIGIGGYLTGRGISEILKRE